ILAVPVHGRVAHASRALVLAARRNKLSIASSLTFSGALREVHEGAAASPAREPRAVPRMFARAFILSITTPRRARHQFGRAGHKPFRLPPLANSSRRNRRGWAAPDDRDQSMRRVEFAPGARTNRLRLWPRARYVQ